jgi:hypothetical protein
MTGIQHYLLDLKTFKYFSNGTRIKIRNMELVV